MADDLIGFRDVRSRDEWCSGNIAPDLARIFLQAANYAAYVTKRHLIVTSIYRTPEEDEALLGHGIHPAWRAIDIHADSWDDPSSKAVVDFLNTRYVYDPLRPTMQVAFFEPHGSGPHIHIQVHGGTTLREPGSVPRPEQTT